MYNPNKPFELRNIKKNPSGFQIQFIVDGKSHSAFETDIEKAKAIRDKMERKLNIPSKGAFHRRFPKNKTSRIPGTNKPMACGITLRTYKRQGSNTHEVLVHWRDYTGKKHVKTFYGCSETRYTRKKMKTAYDRALTFRKAYEQAVLDKTLKHFDPGSFDLKNPD